MAMQAMWAGAIVALSVAVFSGWRDYRRRTRADLDRIGAVDWRTVQMLALIVVAALGYFLWKALQ